MGSSESEKALPPTTLLPEDVSVSPPSASKTKTKTTNILSLLRQSSPSLPPQLSPLRPSLASPSSPVPGTPGSYRLTPDGHLALLSSPAPLVTPLSASAPPADQPSALLYTPSPPTPPGAADPSSPANATRKTTTHHLTLDFPLPPGPSYDIGPVFEAGLLLLPPSPSSAPTSSPSSPPPPPPSPVSWSAPQQVHFAISRNLVWVGQARVRKVGRELGVSGQRAVDLPAKVKLCITGASRGRRGKCEFWGWHKGAWVLVDTVERGVLAGQEARVGEAGGEEDGQGEGEGEGEEQGKEEGELRVGVYAMSQDSVEMHVQEWVLEEVEEDVVEEEQMKSEA